MAKTSTTDTAQSTSDRQAMIAEAAYYKAEKRGFMPGLEVTDWLDAEKELAASTAKPAPEPRRKSKSKSKPANKTRKKAKKKKK